MSEQYGGQSKRQWLDSQRGALLMDRVPFEAMWRLIGENVLPMRPRFCASDGNLRLSTRIIRGTAGRAQRRLRAIIQSELMSPSTEWYELTTGDNALDNVKEVQVWLREERDAQLADLDRSNAYTEADLAVGDAINFATGAIFVEESLETTLHCTALSIGSYAIGRDKRGVVNRIVRDYDLTVSQIMEDFAPTGNMQMLPQVVQRAIEKKDWLARFPVSNFVYPNEDWARQAPEKSLRYNECYWMRGAASGDPNDGILREGGYNEFPAMVPCWERSAGDVYGTDCPGLTALGDILELQSLAADHLRLVALIRKPPTVGPSGVRSVSGVGISLLPGALNEEPQGSGQTRPLIQVNPQALQAVLETMQDCDARVRESYFADVAAPNLDNSRTQPDTAAAVYAKQDERNALMGPTVTRWDDDFSDPFIARLFGIRLRAGLVKPWPAQLAGKSVRVRLISKMAVAQRSVGLAAQERLEQTVLQTAQMGVPQVLDVLAWDEGVRAKARMLGVRPNTVNDDKETAAIRATRQKAMAVQAQQQQAAQQADTAAKLSKVDMNKDTAATRLVSGVQ